MNKPSGIPTQADLSKDKSAQGLAEIYAQRKLHLLNRLDRPASGVLLFSKKESFTKHFNKLQEGNKVQKKYYAITSKADVEKSGKIENYLIHDKANRKARISTNPKEGKLASLSYEIIKELDNYYILDIQLNTGRFHQIRAQLAHAGLFVKGDVKYGARRSNKDRSIYLHAYSYSFKDATSSKIIDIVAETKKGDTLWSQI